MHFWITVFTEQQDKKDKLVFLLLWKYSKSRKVLFLGFDNLTPSSKKVILYGLTGNSVILNLKTDTSKS